MVTGRPILSWREFELAAPPISQLAVQRFDAQRVALLGTLRSDAGDRERLLSAGFDGYLEKPISVRAFPEQIRHHCRTGSDED